jgi:hypothetical protein
MSGENLGVSGASGDRPGPSGGASFARQLLTLPGDPVFALGMAIGAPFTLMVIAVNIATSVSDNAQRAVPRPLIAPFITELSSLVLVLMLAGAVFGAYRFAPPDRALPFAPAPPNPSVVQFWRGVALCWGLHLLFSVAYSLAHVGGMVGLRHLAYGFLGLEYRFAAPGMLLAHLFYEWRKDALSYAQWLALFWAVEQVVALGRLRASQTPGTTRLAFKDGTRTHLIATTEIYWIEAAGNYVEAHLKGRSVLTRATLASFAGQLGGCGFVQVHRSRLVNMAHVAAIAPKPSGDLILTLDDGRSLQASRRYREALMAVSAHIRSTKTVPAE